MLKRNSSMLRGLLITAAITQMAAVGASATTLASYDFAASLAASSTDPNVTAGSFSVGAGLDSDAGFATRSLNLYAKAFATGTTLSEAISGDDYVSFTVAPKSTGTINLTSLVLKAGYSNDNGYTGKILTANLMTSIDGFAEGDLVSSIATEDTALDTGDETYQTWSIDLSDAKFQNITAPIEFRVYLYDDTGHDHIYHRLDDVALYGTTQQQPQAQLSIEFDADAHPVSIRSRSGAELLDGVESYGFYLLESDGTKRRFNTVTDLGDGEYQFTISGSTEQLSVRFEATNDYLTARFTSLSGFALAGEQLKFDLDTAGSGLRVIELDHMMKVVSYDSSVSIKRRSLWETNVLGAFALYAYENNEQEDETLLDLWTMEGLPHPKVDGEWTRAAAEAWLNDWIAQSTDSSYLNMVPIDFDEHSDFLPYAQKMDAKAFYLWNLVWRGEYGLNYRQNDEINPNMYPNGLADMQAFKSEAAGKNLGLMFHYLSGNIGERDKEFVAPTAHPDLQSWGTVTLSGAIDAAATSFVVVPDSGVELPVIGSDQPLEAPPVVSSVFDFKTFRIGNEWIQASSVEDLGNGTWQLEGVSRGMWDTSAASYSEAESLRGYLRPFNDFVPDPNSALFETITTRWADLNNTLGLKHASFDGIEFHKAYGAWGGEKFGALVYQNLDHPTSSDSSAGPAPLAWLEYKFNRVKDALGGDFKPFGQCVMFLGDESWATIGLEEHEYRLNRQTTLNTRGFSLGSYDVSGVTMETLQAHGLTSDFLRAIKNWKHASHAMDSVQREAMNEFRSPLAARTTLSGPKAFGKALWRMKGPVLERWLALGTDLYTHEWHSGQEHGVITPRFYLQNGDVQTLEIPTELDSGADRVRIVGRVLPSYDAASNDNIDLMTYIGSSSLTVSRANATDSPVWSDVELTTYEVSPSLDLKTRRGIGLWVTGDGSGATLVIRLNRGRGRDYVVPINFTGRRWIEIPTGEVAWRVRDWGWTKSTRKFMDYGSVRIIQIGIGHIPAGTTCSVEVDGMIALAETPEALVDPTLTLGEQSVSVDGSIGTENHFILDEDGLFTVYDSNWNALSEQQLDVMLPSDLTTFKMESVSSSDDIWLEVGVQASNETTTNPDPTPSFTTDPIIKTTATEDGSYNDSIAGDASDPAAGQMTFSKLDGPSWLTVASDGGLSGTPAPGDVGLNSFTVQVDSTGGSDTATLNITVENNAFNDAPLWYSDPVTAAPAAAGAAYSTSITDAARDLDAGAALTYTKISGPAWLSVAADGTLSGTPGGWDVSMNSWTVSVSDGIAAPVNATLNISVNERREAEDAVLYDSTSSSYSAGYTGSGYVVMDTASSSYIEWTVNLVEAAEADLSLSHWTDSANTMTLTVNGSVVDSNYNLAGTGGVWTVSSLASVSLNAGLNTIRLNRDRGPDSVRVDNLIIALNRSQAPAGPLVQEPLNYTYMYYQNGIPAISNEPELVFQTGYYSLQLDCDDMQLTGYDALSGTDYVSALTDDVTVFTPATDFVLRVYQDGIEYTCTNAVVKDAQKEYVRLIESGQYVQRIDHTGLVFKDSDGNTLEVDKDCRLEVTAWPDRVTFMLDFSSETTNPITRTVLQVNGHVADSASNQARLTLKPQENAKLGAINPADYVLSATNYQDGSTLAVTFDEDEHAIHISVPAESVAFPAATDRVDEYVIEVSNPSASAKNIPLIFEQPTPRAITGTIMLLCDAADGQPLGVPVQLSKNWHLQNSNRTVHDGTWLRGSVMLPLAAGEHRWVKLRVVYGFWGGAGAISHSQLSLIGYSNRSWKWDESAIGCWGESMTYNPDKNTGEAFICDVRPAFTTSYKTNPDYGWTENVGGGDFLVYYDSANTRRREKRLKTCYHWTGPNMTEVLYTGVTDDDKIRFTYRSRAGATLDYHRRFHEYEYTFLQDVDSPNRLVFYQMAADDYKSAFYNNYTVGDADGVLLSSMITRGGDTYRGAPIAFDDKWLSIDDYYSGQGYSTKALRGMIPLSSTLNGSSLPLYLHRYGIDSTMLFDLSGSSVNESYNAGDIVKGEVEFILPPQHVDDYWGSDAELINRLTAYGESGESAWEPVRDEFVHNVQLDIVMHQGLRLNNYPLEIQPEPSNGVLADFTFNGGGIGHVPILIKGAEVGLKLTAQRWADGVWTDLESVNIAANNYYQGVQNGDGTVNYAFNIPRPSLDLNEGWRIRVVSSDTSVPAGPAAPAGLSAQSGITQVSLDWADNTEPGLTGYTVYRSTATGSGYQAIATVTGSDYIDTDMHASTHYYVVSSRDENFAESAFSSEVTASANQPVVFSSDVISATAVTQGEAFSGSLSGFATDPDSDAITYSKLSGPAWLTVAADGTLSGTPEAASDTAENRFTIQATSLGGSATAQLKIQVYAASDNLIGTVDLDNIAANYMTRDSVGFVKSESSAWSAADGVLSNASLENNAVSEGALGIIINLDAFADSNYNQIQLSFDYTTASASETLYAHLWGYVDVNSSSSTLTMNLFATNGNAWESSNGALTAYNLGGADGAFSGTPGVASDAAAILTGATGAQSYSATFDLSSFTTAPDRIGDYDYLLLGFTRNTSGTNPAVTISNLKLTGIYELSPAYTSWSDGFPGLADRTEALDFDGGGLATGLEYILGGDPADGSDDQLVKPAYTRTDNRFEFQYRRKQTSHSDSKTTIIAEYSSDLSNWNPVVHDTNGVTVTVSENFYGSGIDRVVVSLPDSVALERKLFVRLSLQAE